jgi:hypothetical protein
VNNLQTEKIRRIIRKVQALPEKHDVGGWVEKDHVYVLVKPRSVEHVAHQACLYAIDLDGCVQLYRNYAPLQLHNDNLIMDLAG